MTRLNQRKHPDPSAPIRRRVSILEKFPHDSLEAIVVQWESFRPTVLIQLLRDPAEPIQFPGRRPAVPGNAELSKDLPSALDLPLLDFLDPTSNRVFGGQAFNADLLFSQRAFALMQPEPDLVLEESAMWECRAEALEALTIPDESGIRTAAP